MPLNLKEAEVAAYADPSQENLAVYVKLLEEELENQGDLAKELAELREELGQAPSISDYENMQELCVEAAEALEAVNPDLAQQLRRAVS